MGKMPYLLPPHALGNKGGGHGSAAASIPAAKGSGGGFGVREKGEGSPRGRSPAAARAEAARVGLAATACGSGRRRLWAGDSGAWWRPWRWGKAPGDSMESITPLTLGRGDVQRWGDGRGRQRPLELGVVAL